MENMTLEHLAALIIVATFFGVMGGFIGHEIGRFVCWVIDRVKAWRDRRREEKTDEGTASGSGNQEQC